jgi:hypothetical protein
MDEWDKRVISMALHGQNLEERRKDLERRIADANPKDVPYLEALLATGGLCTPEGLDGLLTEVNEGTKDKKGNVVNKGRVDKWGEDERWTKDYLKYQFRITLTGQEDSIPDYKEVVETLQNGTWMTLQDIKDAGTKTGIDKIRKILNADPEKYRLKRDGRILVAYITPENIKVFRIYYGSPEPGQAKKPEPAQAGKETVRIGGRDYVFDPGVSYDQNYADLHLKLLHQHIFGDPANRRLAVQYLADENGKVNGQKLIDFIRKYDGALPFTKGTIKNIARDIGMHPKSAAEKLKRAEFAKFRRKVEGGFYTGDILMGDKLPQLYEMLRNS